MFLQASGAQVLDSSWRMCEGGGYDYDLLRISEGLVIISHKIIPRPPKPLGQSREAPIWRGCPGVSWRSPPGLFVVVMVVVVLFHCSGSIKNALA